MIIQKKDLKIITGVDYYDGSIIHDRFAYKFFKNKTLRIGNIIAFRASMEVKEHLVDLEDSMNQDYIFGTDAINFCLEIPSIDLFAGVCFQRLFNTAIANILADKYLKCNIEIDGDDIMVQGPKGQRGKVSVSIAKQVNNAVLIHTGINVNAGDKAPSFAYSSGLTDEECNQFMLDCIECFYYMVNDVFLATVKIIK